MGQTLERVKKFGISSSRYNSIAWSEVNPETLGVWQIERDSSLNLAASSVLISSSTGHCSPENPEVKACVFATG